MTKRQNFMHSNHTAPTYLALHVNLLTVNKNGGHTRRETARQHLTCYDWISGSLKGQTTRVAATELQRPDTFEASTPAAALGWLQSDIHTFESQQRHTYSILREYTVRGHFLIESCINPRIDYSRKLCAWKVSKIRKSSATSRAIVLSESCNLSLSSKHDSLDLTSFLLLVRRKYCTILNKKVL